MPALHGQVAIVTGSTRGIGRSIALGLAKAGCNVVVAAKSTESTEKLPGSIFTVAAEVEALGAKALPVRVDVREAEQIENMAAKVLERFGRIDLLVNNAGYVQFGAIEESSIDDAQAQLDTNLFGVMRMLKAVLPVMRQQGSGRIINISSIVGRIASPYGGLYATSKFALEGLSEALSEEVRPFGVSVSLVEPGYVNTPIVSKSPTNPLAVYTTGRQAAQQSLITNGKNGMEPGAVARAILRAATATTRPRLRYPVGRDGKTVLLLKRLLPESAFEALKRRLFSA